MSTAALPPPLCSVLSCTVSVKRMGEHVTLTVTSAAPMVPLEGDESVQLWLAGCDLKPTDQPLPLATAVANVSVVLPLTVRSSPPLSCRTKLVFACSPVTAACTLKVVVVQVICTVLTLPLPTVPVLAVATQLCTGLVGWPVTCTA